VPEGAIRHAVTRGGRRWVVRTDGADRMIEGGLADLLALPLDEARAVLAAATPVDHPFDIAAPADAQEVWAAGVTYERSRDERMAESTEASIYDRVSVAERPELFFKAPASRVMGPGEPVGIRADSDWDVPEPELGLVFTSRGELFGYVPGNDMSSRSIEGQNPLYLPQAKVYEAACALGPAIVPVWAVEGPFGIRLEIERDGAVAFEGSTSTESLTRTAAHLGAWLFAAMPFPAGAVLLTGTGIVPPGSFSLAEGDLVRVLIDGIGTLENPVRVVGTDLRAGSTEGTR
jgi:2-dehydro-3-deoxy-D-arabinonate dehydratase